MAVITDYTTLISNIQALVEDDNQELLDYIPTAISLAEERLIRELDLPELESETTGTLTASSPYMNKPYSKDIGTTSVFVNDSNGNKKILKRRTMDYIYDYWPKTSVTDFPKYYANFDTTRYFLAPTPSTTYSYTIRAFSTPTKLSSSNSTNYFTQKDCVSCLLYATLVNVAIFTKSWSQVEVFEKQFQQAATDWNIQAQRQRRDNGDNPQNPEGGQNTLKNTVGSQSTA